MTAIPKAFGIALQMLLCPGVDAIERFLDVFDRVRHAEAKITFAEIANAVPDNAATPASSRSASASFFDGHPVFVIFGKT